MATNPTNPAFQARPTVTQSVASHGFRYLLQQIACVMLAGVGSLIYAQGVLECATSDKPNQIAGTNNWADYSLMVYPCKSDEFKTSTKVIKNSDGAVVARFVGYEITRQNPIKSLTGLHYILSSIENTGNKIISMSSKGVVNASFIGIDPIILTNKNVVTEIAVNVNSFPFVIWGEKPPSQLLSASDRYSLYVTKGLNGVFYSVYPSSDAGFEVNASIKTGSQVEKILKKALETPKFFQDLTKKQRFEIALFFRIHYLAFEDNERARMGWQNLVKKISLNQTDQASIEAFDNKLTSIRLELIQGVKDGN